MSTASFTPCQRFGRGTSHHRRQRRRGRPYVAVVSDSLEGRVLFSAFVVDTLDDTSVPDDGVVSLREAVQLANASPGDDRVTFAETVRGTITLTGGQLDVTDASGGLTIDGPGADVLSISGRDAGRVFELAGGASAQISGLTITGGKADSGAGIYAEGGTLTVTQCTFAGNHAVGPAGSGGGIYKKGGTLSVSGCTFSGNTADQLGGGIFVDDGTVETKTTVSITGCTFEANAATAGGGLARAYFSYGTTTIAGSTFRDNHASQLGGGFLGAGMITGCTFVGNTADAGGGGMRSARTSDRLSIVDTTFESNRATFGGALSGGPDSWVGEITNCVFRSNEARSGGALSYSMSARGAIVGSVFEDNQATDGGGGAISASETHFDITGGRFVNNRAGTSGGAISVSACNHSLDGVTFIGNQALGGSGGAMIEHQVGALYIRHCQFIDNLAQGTDGVAGANGQAGGDGGAAQGGALAVGSDTISPPITDTLFSGNITRGGKGGSGGSGGNGGAGGDATGGAVSNDIGWPRSALINCTLVNNRAIAGNGGDAGAVAAAAGKGGNAAGGAFYGFLLDPRYGGVIAGSTFVGNAATGGNGGNALSGGAGGNGGNAAGGGFNAGWRLSQVLIKGFTFAANRVTGGSGGTAAPGGTRGNGGNAFGGALFLPASDLPTIDPVVSVSGSRVTHNWAFGGPGAQRGLGRAGGVYSAGQRVVLDAASRVTRNYASSGSNDVFGNVVPPRRNQAIASLLAGR